MMVAETSYMITIDYLLTTVMPPLSLVDNFDFPIEGGIGSYFVTSCCVSS